MPGAPRARPAARTSRGRAIRSAGSRTAPGIRPCHCESPAAARRPPGRTDSPRRRSPGTRTRPSSEMRGARSGGRLRHRGSRGGSRCSALGGRSSRCRCDWRPASTASSGVEGPRAHARGPRASWRLRPRSETRMVRGGAPTLRPRARFRHRLAGGPPFPPGCRGGRSPARGRRARPARRPSRAAGCCGRPVAGTAASRARRP